MGLRSVQSLSACAKVHFTFTFLCYILNKLLKWHALTPISVHPSTSIHFSQEEKLTKIHMEFSPPPNLRNSGPPRIKTKLHGEVLTSSPIIQKKKQKVKRIKNNFKKMVHNPNWSNSYKMVTVTGAKIIRNTCNKTRIRLDKMFSLWKASAWKLHDILQNLRRLWTQQPL